MQIEASDRTVAVRWLHLGFALTGVGTTLTRLYSPGTYHLVALERRSCRPIIRRPVRRVCVWRSLVNQQFLSQRRARISATYCERCLADILYRFISGDPVPQFWPGPWLDYDRHQYVGQQHVHRKTGSHPLTFECLLGRRRCPLSRNCVTLEQPMAACLPVSRLGRGACRDVSSDQATSFIIF